MRRSTARFVALCVAMSIAIPAGAVQPGGSLPLSWLWSWLPARSAVAAPAPALVSKASGDHYVPAEATKASGGTGKAQSRVAGGLPGYAPYEPRKLAVAVAKPKLSATTASTLTAKTLTAQTTTTSSGAPQLDLRYPANNYAVATLTPQLIARGHDPDNYPNQGLQYYFGVYDIDGNPLADSGWQDGTCWTIPAGKLHWGKTYLYLVQISDRMTVNSDYPAFAFTTTVPQPSLSSKLSQNADKAKGFDPASGNYTTEVTDADVSTTGPDLQIKRSYNSQDLRTRQGLGRGWSSIVDSRATEARDGAGTLQTVVVTKQDGQDIAFGREADGSFVAPAGRTETLSAIVVSGSVTGYQMTEKDGTSHRFAQNAGSGVFKISAVTDANGRALTFTYGTDGNASKMQAASGRTLGFKWATPAGGNYQHVTEIFTDPEVPGNAGTAKTWQYTYDNDKLVKVCSPVSWTYCSEYEYQWMSQYANAVRNESPFSYWRLNEATSATIAASSAEANSGIDNAVYHNVTTGQVSGLDSSAAKAASFNGTSSYVQLPGNLIADGSYQSISMWFKTTAVNGVLFSYSADPIANATTPGNYTPALYIGNDGKLRGQFWQGDAHHPITSSAALNDGNWHHAVLAGAGNTQTLYVDGYAQGTLDGTIAQNPNGSCQVYLGTGFLGGDWPNQPWNGQYPAHAAYFNGTMTDVAWFDRPLSAGAVNDLFNIGKWPRSVLTKALRPSGSVAAQITYDGTTGNVAQATDANGGTWTLGKPSLAGNSNVYAAAVLGGRPGDYWRLGDVSGTTDAVNQVAGGLASYRNVALEGTGPFADAKAARFNGTSSYMDLGSRNVPGTGPNTVSLWFSMPSASAAGGVLYGYQEAPMSNLSAGTSWTPALYVGTDGKLRGGLWTGSVSNVMTGPAVNDGKWHHVVLTAGSNNQVLYLDGVQVCSSNAGIQATTGTHAYLGAGKWAGDWPSHNGEAGYFLGSIAEFAYYNVKLSADQVSGQFKAAKQATAIAITKVDTSVSTIAMPVSTVEVTDPGGRKLSYSYDVLNGSRAVQEQDALGNVTKYGYDTGGNSNLTYDPRGVLTERVTDARGNVLQTITCQDQAARKCSSTYYGYDSCDNLIAVREARSSSASDTTYLTGYGYDARRNRTEINAPLGRRSTAAYTDGTTVAAVDGGYAPPGLPVRLLSPTGSTTSYQYFKTGDVARITDANGRSIAYTYDGLGRPLSETEYTSSFPGGIVTRRTYDAVGNVLTQTDPPVTNRVTGNVHSVTVTSQYNVDGLAVRHETADTTGGDVSRVISTTYNAAGEVETVTGETGGVTRYAYDLYGKTIRIIEPNGDITLNSYDAEGNLLTSAIAAFTGDPNNPSPPTDLVTVSKAYDPSGRLASETDAAGATRKYTYTDDGHVAKVLHTDGSAAFTEQENTYDPAGNLLSQVSNNGATTTVWTYDAAGHKTSETLDPSGLKRTTSYTYAKDDKLVAVRKTDGSGVTVGLTETMYDYAGQPVAETRYTTAGLTPTGRWNLAGSLADSSGNNPVAWQGGSASFDGTGYLKTAGPAVDSARSFTATAWVSLSEAKPYERVVSANGNRMSSFHLRYQGDVNRWVFSMQHSDSDNSQGTDVRSTSTPQLGTWTHLAAVYDAATGVMSLYVNGTLECTTTNTQMPFTGTGPVMIGAGKWNGGIVDQFKGGIKDVQLYQKALSGTEIAQVKAGTAPPADATVIRESSILDSAGLPVGQSDPRGNITTLSYDERGRATQATAPQVLAESNGGAPVSAIPVSTTGYDSFGAVTHQRDPLGNVTVIGYDAGGREVSRALPGYTPPGSSTPISAVSAKAYDTAGRVESQSDPLGNTTHYSYDQMDRVSKVVAADGGVTTYTYDLVGNQLSSTDAAGAVSSASYDYRGRRLSVSEVDRKPALTTSTITYSFTGAGWPAQTRSAAGVTETRTYNAAGEAVTLADGAGKVTTQAFDATGTLSRLTRPDGTYTAYISDLAGRTLAVGEFAADGTQLATQSKAYDAAGNVVAIADPRGTVTTSAYDAAGRLVSVTEPVSGTDSIVNTFGYDLAGNRTRYTDGRGGKFLSTYNPWGLPESSVEPVTVAHPAAADRTFTAAYDAAGRAVTLTEPGGITVIHTYDTVGRLTRQTGSGAEATTAERSFGYDAAGRMTSITAGAGTNTVSYDDRGHVLSVTGPSGNSSFGYDNDGRMLSRVDAAGTTSYTYDAGGRLSTVDNASLKASFTYDSLSAIDKIVYGDNGDVRQFGYDALHRVVSDELRTTGGASVAKITYGWDVNGNEVSKNTTGFAGSASNTYTYDLAGRLTSWNGTAYAYDKSGNRTQAGSNSFSYDERNRLLAGAGASYVYSPRGTLRTATVGSTATDTQADAFGQIVKQGTATYSYDGLGRVQKTGLAYTGLGNHLASDGQTQYARDTDGDLIGAGGTLVWTDLHNDVVGQFSATASVLSGSVAYDPLGKVIASSTMLGSLGYQSEWTDSGTGRVNMHARWYNPDTGQFDTRDNEAGNPSANTINANRYQYGDGNPLTVTDPSGHVGIPRDYYRIDPPRAPAPKPATTSPAPRPNQNPRGGVYADDPAPANRAPAQAAIPSSLKNAEAKAAKDIKKALSVARRDLDNAKTESEKKKILMSLASKIRRAVNFVTRVFKAIDRGKPDYVVFEFVDVPIGVKAAFRVGKKTFNSVMKAYKDVGKVVFAGVGIDPGQRTQCGCYYSGTGQRKRHADGSNPYILAPSASNPEAQERPKDVGYLGYSFSLIITRAREKPYWAFGDVLANSGGWGVSVRAGYVYHKERSHDGSGPVYRRANTSEIKSYFVGLFGSVGVSAGVPKLSNGAIAQAWSHGWGINPNLSGTGYMNSDIGVIVPGHTGWAWGVTGGRGGAIPPPSQWGDQFGQSGFPDPFH